MVEDHAFELNALKENNSDMQRQISSYQEGIKRLQEQHDTSIKQYQTHIQTHQVDLENLRKQVSHMNILLIIMKAVI